MKKSRVFLTVLLLVCGCEAFRYPVTEAQKENAWLHRQTTHLTAEQARTEQTSQTLQDLTALARRQSEAFVADYGPPKEIPIAVDADAILAAAPATAQQAEADSARRIDPVTLSA